MTQYRSGYFSQYFRHFSPLAIFVVTDTLILLLRLGGALRPRAPPGLAGPCSSDQPTCAQNPDIHSVARSGKLDRARSRLYRGQILQENMRLKALVEIYTMQKC